MSRNRSSSLLLLFAAFILVAAGIYYAIYRLKTPGQVAQPTQPAKITTLPAGSAAGAGADLSWLTVYFTNPNPPDNIGHGIDSYVINAIEGAAKGIDVTSFDFNLPGLVNALGDASKRGVNVRVVYDGANGGLELQNELTDYKTFNTLATLKAAGVGLVNAGRADGIMHDKFVIVDGKTLFMGSWNLSYNDTYRNNNNLLKITDPQIITNYQAKFNELYVNKKFGVRTTLKALPGSITISGTAVENYFSPADGVMSILIKYVQGARKSVHYMIFTFTDENLAAAMIARAKAGVDVQGVIEERNATQGALVSLFCAKTAVKTDGNKYTMHHKVIIIDGQIVITGSFNFTKSADDSNDENVLIIHSPAIAAQYEQEYQRIKSIAVTPTAADINCRK